MNNLFYDPQIFYQKVGGISRYFVEVINRLSQEPDFNVTLPLIYTQNKYLKASPYLNFDLDFDIINSHFLKNYAPKLYGLNHKKAIHYLKNREYDIVHTTYYDNYFLPYLKNSHLVTTIHDLIHERGLYNQQEINKKDNTVENRKKQVETASAIVAVSENTKKDLVDILNVSPEKVRVIYHGVSFNVEELEKNVVRKIPQNYILYVGSRAKYKNFDRFLSVAAELIRQNLDLYLVCTGGGEWSEEEKEWIKKQGIDSKIINFDYVDDAILYSLYKYALCFIFPSLYEGFGIPILEAFAAKCPMALSQSSCFPEIAENGAAYFDPYDEASMYQSINHLLFNTQLQTSLIENGEQRLRFFSWDKCASQHKELYLSLFK